MKKVSLAVLASALVMVVRPGMADDKHAEHEGPSIMCPVMNEEVANFFTSVETDEGPVYFCCRRCIRTFEKDPARFKEQVAAQREVLAKMPKVQVKCPVSDEPVDPKVTIEHDGKTVGFCCKRCVKAYEAEPGKYAAKLANSYSYQTICPVMGEPINPKVSFELPTGETIYYCCKGCHEKLLKNPEKYNDKLVAQGIHINWDRVKEKMGD